jgi:crossover junction endodeoxyribonuclease RusA
MNMQNIDKNAPWNSSAAPSAGHQTDLSPIFDYDKRVRCVLELPWPPITGNRATRHTKGGGHYRLAEAVSYRQGICTLVAAQKLDLRLFGPLAVDWVLVPPDNRARDAVNVLKEVEDCLTHAGVWHDDSNRVIRRLTVEWLPPELKRAKGSGKILVTIRELSQ